MRLQNTVGLEVSISTVLLLLLGLFTYWDGLWGGVPRGEHLVYLYQFAGYENFWELLKTAFIWDRTDGLSIYTPLRPIWRLQLALFYFAFDYNFFAWQLGSLLMHMAVVLGLYSLLVRVKSLSMSLRFLLTALFACGFGGLESVLWSHSSGYLMFCAFSVYAISYCLKFCESNEIGDAYTSLTLAVMAVLTFELAFGLCLLLAKMFASVSRNDGRRSTQIIPWLFLGAAFICAAVTCYDAFLHSVDSPIFESPFRPVMAAWMVFVQLGAWLFRWLIPWGNIVEVGAHTMFKGYNDSGSMLMLNVVFVSLLIFAAILLVSKAQLSASLRRDALKRSAISLIAFLLLYSFIVVLDASLSLSLEDVLSSHSYYAYPLYCGLIAGLALALIYVENTGECKNSVLSDLPTTVGRNIQTMMTIALFGLVVMNGMAVRDMAAKYRDVFSPPQLEIIQKIVDWVEISDKEGRRYFGIHESCKGNVQLPWFKEDLLRSGHFLDGSLNLLDALFPQHSYRLNQHLDGVEMKTIICYEKRIQASSQHMQHGPEGLLHSRAPGWHSAISPDFPQQLELDFGFFRVFQDVSFLAQAGEPKRAPKLVAIESINQHGDWVTLTKTQLNCENDSEVWQTVSLPQMVRLRLMRITIYSNCGDTQLLTLRGLAFE